MAKKANRVVVSWACSGCKERNYTTEKNRKNDASRLVLMEYCRRCRKHAEHREQR